MPRVTEDALANRDATRQSLTAFNRNVLFRAVFDIVCGPTSFIFVAFVLSLGVPGESMGRLAAVASFGSVTQILLLPIITRTERKRAIIGIGMTEPLLVMATVLMVPLLPPGYRLYALMGAIFSAAAFLSITRPVMDDWQAATIPETLRGRYLGRRIQMMGFVTIASMLAAGSLGDWAGQQGAGGLSLLLAAGCGFGLLAILSLVHAHDSGGGSVTPVDVHHIPRVFRTRDFRRLMIGSALYNIPFFFGCPFYQVLNKQVLGMTNTNIAWMMTAYCVAKMIMSRSAGRLLDRFGARRIAVAVGPLYALFFLLLPLATADRHWPIYLAWALAGPVDAAFGLCIQTGLMGAVPAQGARPAYFAVSNIVSLGLYGIGGPLAEAVMRHIGPGVWTVGPLEIGRYHLLYAACGVMMLGTTFAGLLWPRPGRSTPQTA